MLYRRTLAIVALCGSLGLGLAMPAAASVLDDITNNVARGETSQAIKLISKCSRTTLNQRNEMGRTLLSEAVDCGDHKVVKYLLSRGANPNVKDESGLTPLMLSTHDIELMKMLISYGGQLNTICDERTVLDYAIDRHRLNIGGTMAQIKFIKSNGGISNRYKHMREYW